MQSRLFAGIAALLLAAACAATPEDGAQRQSHAGATPAAAAPVTSATAALPPTPSADAPVVLRGRVVDADGRPVADAEIVHVGDAETVLARTGASGRFDASVIPPLRSVQARAAGHVPSLIFDVVRGAPANGAFDMALRGPAGDLTVRVLADGRPAAGALVTVGGGSTSQLSQAGDRRIGEIRPIVASADGQGVARFRGIAIGTTQAQASLGRSQAPSRDVEIAAGRAAEVELTLVPRPTIRERVAAARVSAEFADTPATSAVAALASASGVSIVIAPAVADRMDAAYVSLSLRNRSLTDALRDLCRLVGHLRFDVGDDAIVLDRAD